jgi:protein ImuA
MVVVRIPTSAAASPPPVPQGRVGGGEIVCALKGAIRAIEEGARTGDDRGLIPLGVPAIDAALGGGIARAAFHEIAAASESAVAAATGFALALAARAGARPVLWIAEDLGLVESGTPYGPGLDEFGLAPERLVTAAAAKPRDVLWAMEEAVRCRAVGAVIGELRHPGRAVDLVASRRLSLAAGNHDGCALLLRSQPGEETSAAATRWIVAPAAPSLPSPACGGGSGWGPAAGPGPPRLFAELTRNRRGPVGSWLLEWNRVERRFDLASSLSVPVAAAAFDRPHRTAALGA